MTNFAMQYGGTALAAVLLSLALTRAMIALAHRRGWVAKPKKDRWHQTPTALFGGVAIFGTFALSSAFLLRHLDFSRHYDLLGLLVGGLILFAVGLRDDIRALNPLVKLLGQVLAITPFLVGLGLTHTSSTYILLMPLLLFWMLTLTNSFNLLDNMDGHSAGVATVVASLLTVYGLTHGLVLVAGLSALIAASCLGFLWFNFRLAEPARIFMGDCSSMFLGFMLAGLAVIGMYGGESGTLMAFSLPLLLMALPLFDTTLVIIRRKREGRAISQGGRDHSSHRLVYAGLTDKQATLLLDGLTLLTGGLGLVAERLHQSGGMVALLALCAAGLVWLGIYLSRFSGTPKAAVTLITPLATASGENGHGSNGFHEERDLEKAYKKLV